MTHLWFGYFWPSIQGNGPEALVQTIVYGAIAIIFVPPIRKWFKREYEKVHTKIDHATKLSEHIIHHSKGIPNEDREGNLLIRPEEKK